MRDTRPYPTLLTSLALLLPLLLAAPAAAHNEVDVVSGIQAHGTWQGGELVSHQLERCDPAPAPLVCPQEPAITPGGDLSAGFAYAPLEAEHLVASVACEYEVVDAKVPVRFSLEVEHQTVCELEVDVGESGSLEATDRHAFWPFPQPDTFGRVPFDAASTVEIGAATTAELGVSWLQGYVHGGVPNPLGTLEDPSSEDTYVSVADGASRYVILDPSGDSEFHPAFTLPTGEPGTQPTVAEGVLLAHGVTVTRAEQPHGPGVLWVFEHVLGEPMAVELIGEEGDRRTFQVTEYLLLPT